MVADLLERAAEIIEVNGWHKFGLWPLNTRVWTEGTPVCVMGALCVASGSRRARLNEDASLACEVLKASLGGKNLVQFNDQVAKDVGEVLDLLKNTAKDLRNGVPVGSQIREEPGH